jgi:hypothetical protein
VNDATAAGWYEAATAIIGDMLAILGLAIIFFGFAAIITTMVWREFTAGMCQQAPKPKPTRRPAKKAVRPRPARSTKRAAANRPPVKNRPKLISPRPKAAKTGRKG